MIISSLIRESGIDIWTVLRRPGGLREGSTCRKGSVGLVSLATGGVLGVIKLVRSTHGFPSLLRLMSRQKTTTAEMAVLCGRRAVIRVMK